jgi:hypothetical protein
MLCRIVKIGKRATKETLQGVSHEPLTAIFRRKVALPN